MSLICVSFEILVRLWSEDAKEADTWVWSLVRWSQSWRSNLRVSGTQFMMVWLAAHKVFTWSSDDGLCYLTTPECFTVGRYLITVLLTALNCTRMLQSIKDKCIHFQVFWLLPTKKVSLPSWLKSGRAYREESSPFCVCWTYPLGHVERSWEQCFFPISSLLYLEFIGF